MSIQLLAADVAAKIAAGEVVERPANVAKELLENSVDAGATEIRVEIRDGGQRLLRVTDNGEGIRAGEVELAFQRHATSKLRQASDLDHIATFGFRGEALYSIAAISHTTLTTRHRNEQAGTTTRLEGGVVVQHGRAGAPQGTVVNVEHLFYNVPVRQKFLRQPATEAGRISSAVQRAALAHPDRRFSLINDGKLVFQSNGTGDLFDVLVKLYGLDNAKQMVPIGTSRLSMNEVVDPLEDEVQFMSDSASETNPKFKIQNSKSPIVSGYASLPTLTRANRRYIDLFVNRRHVEDRNLTYAVVQAYHTLLQVGRQPIAAIFVDVDPGEVDVNVHPRKSEVRLHSERQLFTAIQKEIRRAIVDNAPVPDFVLPGSGQAAGGRSGAADNSAWANGVWSVPRVANPVPAAQPQQPLDFWSPPANLPATAASPTAPLPTASPDEAASRAEEPSPALTEKSRNLPPLRVVGQVGAIYIITEGPEGLYLIDQHAAHERILYEKLMAARYADSPGSGAGVPQQQLLEPLTFHAGGETAGLVEQHLDELNAVGFSVEPFGGDTFLVRAVPSALSDQDPLRLLQEIVGTLGEGRNLVGEALEARLVKLICKRVSIKAGQQLSEIEMRELVRQLEECQSPRTCPHGRPTMIQLSAGELEKAFGRT